jgi:prophage antirepressor-like protein
MSDGHRQTVNEPGLYRLILMSRRPEAEQFMRWICHDVLPSIRQTGSYTLPEARTALDTICDLFDPMMEGEDPMTERTP